MQTFDYTPIPLKFTFVRGQSWKFTVSAESNTSIVNFNIYSITALIFQDGVEIEKLSTNHGISVAGDGSFFILKKDWIIRTLVGGLPVFTPELSTIAIGSYEIQILLTDSTGGETVPVFLYVDVTEQTSDSSVERASSDVQIDISLNGNVFIGMKVSPISDRIEWRTNGSKVQVRYIGEETWHDWVDLQSVPFPASLGGYNATTNTPALTVTPPTGVTEGSYYDIINPGTLAFSGVNFVAGVVVNEGDELKKQGTLWLLIRRGTKITKSFIKTTSDTYTDLENKVLTAIRVLDLTVPSAQKANDWRIIFVSTIPTSPALVANFKYKVQVKNITTGVAFTIVDENSTFDATSLNGDKIYRGSVTASGSTVTFNVQIDWVYLLSLGDNFEYFPTTSNLKLKTGIFTQTSEIVKQFTDADKDLLTEINSTRYDFLANKLASYTATEISILRAIKILDITVPTAEKGDDWRITFVTTIPTTSGLVSSFKYRFMIRNITKSKDYALINENTTFDATTLNGFKNYNGTVTNTGTSVAFNLTIDWNVLLALGATFEHNNYATNLVLRKGVFSQTTDNINRIAALETSNTLLAGTKVPAIENILSDFYINRLYTIIDKFYVAKTAVGQVPAIVGNDYRRYVKLPVLPGDTFYVTSTVNGSALALATFVDVENKVLSVFEPGVDNTDHVHVNYALTPPTGAVFCYIDGSITVDIVIDRMRPNFWFGIDGSLNASTYRRYAKYPINPITDRIKVTTTVNGAGVWSVLYLNAAGTVINGTYQGQGENGKDKTWTDLLLVPPATATHFILNSNTATPYYIYTPQPIVQAASKVYVDGAIAANKTYVDDKITTVNTRIDNLQIASKWKDKTIVWFDTSIGEWGYPQILANNLGATMYNESVGSSMCRQGKIATNPDTDPYGWQGLAWENVCFNWSAPISVKNYLISNWDTVRLLLGGSDNNPVPLTLSSTLQAKILDCSYENKLYRHLSSKGGTSRDMYVIGHGHNDNLITDSDSQYINVPANSRDKQTYIGSINCMIDEILKDNPRAKIVFAGHYENARKTRISLAQQTLANYWGFPLLKMWEKTGWSQQVVATTGYWTDQYTWVNSGGPVQNLTMTQIWMYDNLHPASIPAKTLLANIGSEFIDRVR